jgi:MoaA/NifB/PqqE/SkfB family radical SAM enzyme
MPLNLAILYRGPLSSCNYGCDYCPFAKHAETAAELAEDRRALGRFVDWVAGRTGDALSVLFTPWGEALIRRWYQEALARLTGLSQVKRAAIQTNLSCPLGWVEECDKRRLALWTTFHSSQVSRARFLARCLELDRRDVRFSVGAVGVKESYEEIRALRHELPPHVYLWVNALKRAGPGYYTEDDLRRFEEIDPLFRINTRHHPSRDRSCRAGRSVVSVDGDGTVRRCHFIKESIGNLYAAGFEQALVERPCTNDTCGCHIGYVHLDHLGLYPVFGDGILERIPALAVWQQPSETAQDGRRELAVKGC